jgi:hypothetical protein
MSVSSASGVGITGSDSVGIKGASSGVTVGPSGSTLGVGSTAGVGNWPAGGFAVSPGAFAGQRRQVVGTYPCVTRAGMHGPLNPWQNGPEYILPPPSTDEHKAIRSNIGDSHTILGRTFLFEFMAFLRE